MQCTGNARFNAGIPNGSGNMHVSRSGQDERQDGDSVQYRDSRSAGASEQAQAGPAGTGGHPATDRNPGDAAPDPAPASSPEAHDQEAGQTESRAVVVMGEDRRAMIEAEREARIAAFRAERAKVARAQSEERAALRAADRAAAKAAAKAAKKAAARASQQAALQTIKPDMAREAAVDRRPDSVTVIPASKKLRRLKTNGDDLELARRELAQLRPASPRRRHRLILASFVLGVLIPVGLVGWYLYTRAADQYASYVGFLVRSEKTGMAADPLSGLAQMAGNGSSETDILYKYIQSSTLVDAVDKKLDLRAIWSGHPEDFVFNYGGDSRIEALHRHWQRQVRIYYDKGMLDLRVLAYRPEDSRRIAEAILEESQNTLNRINAVARQDSLRYAQADLDRAVQRLKEARQQVSDFRQANQIIDPTADVSGQTGILAKLEDELAQALIQKGTIDATTSNNSDPRIQQLDRRIKVIRDQIAEQRANIASAGPKGNADLSAIVTRYEALEVDRQSAEAAYTAAVAAFEAARAEASRQTLYLASYVMPEEAQTAEYPQRMRLLLTIGGFILSAWLIAVLFYYGARDRR